MDRHISRFFEGSKPLAIRTFTKPPETPFHSPKAPSTGRISLLKGGAIRSVKQRVLIAPLDSTVSARCCVEAGQFIRPDGTQKKPFPVANIGFVHRFITPLVGGRHYCRKSSWIDTGVDGTAHFADFRIDIREGIPGVDPAHLSHVQRIDVECDSDSGVYTWNFGTEENGWKGPLAVDYPTTYTLPYGGWIGLYLYDYTPGTWREAVYSYREDW